MQSELQCVLQVSQPVHFSGLIRMRDGCSVPVHRRKARRGQRKRQKVLFFVKRGRSTRKTAPIRMKIPVCRNFTSGILERKEEVIFNGHAQRQYTARPELSVASTENSSMAEGSSPVTARRPLLMSVLLRFGRVAKHSSMPPNQHTQEHHALPMKKTATGHANAEAKSAQVPGDAAKARREEGAVQERAIGQDMPGK